MICVGLVLCGCGGGGGDSSSPSSAEGLWIGSASTGRTVSGLVLDDQSYWVLYSQVGNPAVIAGAFQGNGTSSNGTFTSSNGLDFNLEGFGIQPASVSASYATKQNFNGTATYPGPIVVSFTSTYSSDYDLTPSLSAIAGTYTGTAATSAGSEGATVTISALGIVTGLSVGGCSFSGSASTRSRGNVFNVSITFGGGVCVNGTSTVTGVAYFEAPLKLIRSAALNGARSDGFIYVGTKP